MLTAEQPDVVLVEAGDTNALSLRAAVTTRRVLPDASVVMTALVPHNEDLADFVKAGVAGFVLKEATGDELVDAVRTVADGSHVLPDALTSPLFVQLAADGMVLDDDETGQKVSARVDITLTLREQQIVALIGDGLANKEIAARLFITTDTVKSHIRDAMGKTGFHTRLLLARRVAKHLGAAPRVE